jgi:hypothetical protein
LATDFFAADFLAFVGVSSPPLLLFWRFRFFGLLLLLLSLVTLVARAA